MNVLATGGAGYIGTHTIVALQQSGHDVVVVDNLSNSSEAALNRAAEITGQQAKFYKVDVRDESSLDGVFKREKIDAVIHFAGLKAVGESVENPLKYYDVNLGSTMTLLKVMDKHGVHKLVFSSSATVYGFPERLPLSESAPRSAINPYGQTKLIIENMLFDLMKSSDKWKLALLRYFNPVGAHPSGLIGEDPNDTPNNLMPYITQVASGKLNKLNIFGNDYDTADGTGVRDYIHVCDLAEGHLAALNKLDDLTGNGKAITVNLGTGTGYSVLDMVNSFQRVNNIQVPYEITSRRPGDAASCYADPRLANKLLGWSAYRDLDTMCRDAWNWQRNNPAGYSD